MVSALHLQARKPGGHSRHVPERAVRHQYPRSDRLAPSRANFHHRRRVGNLGVHGVILFGANRLERPKLRGNGPHRQLPDVFVRRTSGRTSSARLIGTWGATGAQYGPQRTTARGMSRARRHIVLNALVERCVSSVLRPRASAVPRARARNASRTHTSRPTCTRAYPHWGLDVPTTSQTARSLSHPLHTAVHMAATRQRSHLLGRVGASRTWSELVFIRTSCKRFHEQGEA